MKNQVECVENCFTSWHQIVDPESNAEEKFPPIIDSGNKQNQFSLNF